MRIQSYLNESPVFALGVAYNSILGRLNRELRRQNLNFWEALVLLAVFFEGAEPVTPSRLSEVFQLSRPAISHSLSHLESLGLVERRLNARDARSYRILVTREGRQRASRLIKGFDSLQKSVEKGLGEKAVAGLTSSILRLRDHCIPSEV